MGALRRVGTILLALACLAAGQAMAAVSVVHSDATGLPMGLATPTVTFNIGADYPFNSLNLLVLYDSDQLTFEPGSSTVTVGLGPAAITTGFNNFIAALELATSPNFLSNVSTPGIYGFVTSVTPGQSALPVTGPVTVTAAFALADNLSGPAFVTYSGDISGQDEHPFGGTITITAVPEPETWLLWLAGLGLLTAGATRRPAPRTARQ